MAYIIAHNRNICPQPVFSYKLGYIIGFGLVEMAISTNPKPTIYRNLYENTGPAHFWGYPMQRHIFLFARAQEPSSGHPAILLFRVDPEDDRLEPDGSSFASTRMGNCTTTACTESKAHILVQVTIYPQASDLSRWPSRPIRSLRYILYPCKRIRALVWSAELMKLTLIELTLSDVAYI